MSDVVIRAEGLGKKYVIGHETGERYTALRDVLANQARRLARSARDMAAGRALIAGDEREEFWALKNVNFEIRRGEVVGIIGRNGAGKSTLLKVLSRITEPTEGRVTIDGRVASLLEVGTGFHPELTGRENIYLNGAILGMTRSEIRRKFDEIVDFAGVSKFLDTPVKRYSSGMYVRLAFSVAAHLEPEILVVDEVLAVGDAEFQKKCLGKMQDVAGEGRTVLFVTHNRAAVSRLCPTTIWLDAGRVKEVGETARLLAHYAGLSKTSYHRSHSEKPKSLAHFVSISVENNADGSPTLFAGQDIALKISLEKKSTIFDMRLVLNVLDEGGQVLFVTNPQDHGVSLSPEAGRETFRVVLPSVFLPKRYSVYPVLWSPTEGIIDKLEPLEFDVIEAHGSKYDLAKRFGVVWLTGSWTKEKEGAACDK